MKFFSKQIFDIGLLVSVSLFSSSLVMHLGLTSSEFGFFPIIIAALAGGFFSGCVVNGIRHDKSLPHHTSYTSWHTPLAGTMTALLPVIFIVCAVNLHDEFPRHSFFNKLLGQYHEKISPLHKKSILTHYHEHFNQSY